MNELLRLNAPEYGKAFVDCYRIYKSYFDIQHSRMDYKNITNEDIGTQITISLIDLRRLEDELKLKYETFARCLRKELKVTPNWGDQDILFMQLKLLMPDEIFDNDILKTDKQILANEIIEKAKSKDDSVTLISLMQTMYDCLFWFDHNAHASILKYSLSRLNSQIPADVDDNEFFSTSEKSDKLTILNDEIVASRKITRDGIWSLFTMLRQKGVIKGMPDTELSELVGRLTDYSAEKLRQSKLHTQSSKDKLVLLLEDIISKIKS